PIPVALAAVVVSVMESSGIRKRTIPPASVPLIELEQERVQTVEQVVTAIVAVERPGTLGGNDAVEKGIGDSHRGTHGILHSRSARQRHQNGVSDLPDGRNRRIGDYDDRGLLLTRPKRGSLCELRIARKRECQKAVRRADFGQADLGYTFVSRKGVNIR